jgi:hypothetical protein
MAIQNAKAAVQRLARMFLMVMGPSPSGDRATCPETRVIARQTLPLRVAPGNSVRG